MKTHVNCSPNSMKARREVRRFGLASASALRLSGAICRGFGRRAIA